MKKKLVEETNVHEDERKCLSNHNTQITSDRKSSQLNIKKVRKAFQI